ncbi:MAG: MlaD family protein, partial [Proteobacteria bacterium]|nr:MlaD family protein [Pseudomonadota bacterium]
MKQGLIETVVGFVVLFVAATFFLFAYNNSSYSRVAKTYSLVSSFQNIEGIAKGADVKLAGIKIGYVDNLILE